MSAVAPAGGVLAVQCNGGNDNVKLPDSFPAGTRFADVEGVPCTLTPEWECRAWDTAEPRRFNGASFSHNGTLLSEPQFRALVARANPHGMKLPESFPPRTEFKEIGGEPVSSDSEYCWAWGAGDPHSFSMLRFHREGTPLTEGQFRELVERGKQGAAP
jgi:hypothetical protein